jgi:hypothetical protein
MRTANRNEKLQILFAILGLVCACFSAVLIMSLFTPRSNTSYVDIKPEVNAYLEVFDRYWKGESRSSIRGQRSLMARETFLVQTAFIGQNATSSIIETIDARAGQNDSTTPSATAPTLTDVLLPSSSPTAIFEQILPPLTPIDNMSTDANNRSAFETAPAIMVGFASCIIVFAAILYGHDVRSRFQETNEVNKKPVTAEIAVAEGETTAGSIGESGYWINTTTKTPASNPALPTVSTNQSAPHQDELSISRLSTMTESVMGSPWSFGVDEKLMALETSSQVTELSDEHLVPLDTSALAALMNSRRDDDSWTSAEDEDAQFNDHLYGEAGGYEAMDSPRPSFEYPPNRRREESDAPSNGSEDSDARVSPVQLEGLIASIPFHQMSDNPSIVRDIYFHPGNKRTKIGLQVMMKDGYPTVVVVEPSSPLAGRIYCGDCILSVNDMDSTTYTLPNLMAVFNAGSIVKLTVCSIEIESGSDSSSTVDLTELNDAIEV